MPIPNTSDLGSAFKATKPGKPEKQHRPIKSSTSMARIVYLHYSNQKFGHSNVSFAKTSDSVIYAIDKGVIDVEITSVTVQKNMRSAAGTFQIELLPSKNWKSVLSPGDWVFIYIYDKAQPPIDMNDLSSKDLICLGNIDRVSRTRTREKESDKVNLRYSISGRDFGKVFEESDLFFNPYVAQSSNVKTVEAMLHSAGLSLTGSPNQLVNQIINVFLNEKGETFTKAGQSGKTSSSPTNQWRVPGDFARIFGKTTAPFSKMYFQALLKTDIPKLPGFKMRTQVEPHSDKSIWSYMKENSNAIVNDMYCELKKDKSGVMQPTLILKPRPVSPQFEAIADSMTLSKLKGAYENLIDKFEKGEEITISPEEIMFENIGRDGRTMFNLFWLTPSQTQYGQANEMANVQSIPGKISLPVVIDELVQRSGVKRRQATIDFTYDQQTQMNNSVELYRAFLTQFFDQNRFNHIYETGTIESAGKQAELGAVLNVLPESETSKNKLYYIEGYTHKYKYPSKWTTEWVVTMGIFNDPVNPFIDLPNQDSGQPDEDLIRSYLANTIAHRAPSQPSGKDAGGLGGLIKKGLGGAQ